MTTEVNNRLFIHNLSYKIREDELEDRFSKFGKVLSCKMPKNENGNSKGYSLFYNNLRSYKSIGID